MNKFTSFSSIIAVNESRRLISNDIMSDKELEEYILKTGKKIQDAHEAIRPTDVTRTPVMLKESLSRDQLRLYQLIWKRFVASRMKPARFENTSVKIAAGEYRFNVSASRVIFEGFRTVYMEADEEKEENNVLVRGIDENSKLKKEDFEAKQHFT